MAPTVFNMKLEAVIRTLLSLNLKVDGRKCQVQWGMLERMLLVLEPRSL